MERPNDVWLRAICIPLIILMANLLYLEDSHYNLVAYAFWSAVGIAYALLMWEITIRWLLFVRRRYTGIGQTRRRVLITFGGYFVITSSLQALIIWLADLTNLAAIAINWTVYARLIAVGLVCVLFVGAFYELIYYIQKYREAVQESEAIKKVGLQTQYDNLKNQVNPHFLFNSLNSLSALITEDRGRAGLFLDELSSVYRYLLQAGQRPLVTLDEEMTFLQAYRYLLDTRFGESLRWEINVGEQYLDQWLPPLSLQTLIENALRHNVLLPDKPLTLHLATPANGSLVVCNGIQRKRAVVFAQQGGLSLLAARYESLQLPPPLITDNGQQFVVSLPLAQKEQVLDTLSLTNVPMK
ncbi:sensor histidine kinase [Fibrella aestuarina]|uniref:sensor histidine kinase n=1 Tax=Fibrella aestuarina TaxID=651143 RepID=UPI00130E0E38|nr:histidine kinase [Fibrella aestuarina]